MGRGKFKAFSAGSEPRGHVHPLALHLLRKTNHDVSALRSKSWHEFATPDAPALDFVFILCDELRTSLAPRGRGSP
jgi:arsenate reductase